MASNRKHHYCPESYLAYFSSNGAKDGNLWVKDKQQPQKEPRKSKPKEEAHQRDFYRIDVVEGGDPLYLENAFSVIEGEANQAIQHILLHKTLPNVEKMEYLISFIGLLSVRTPSFRKKIANFKESVMKRVVDLACATKSSYDFHLKQMKQSGIEVPDDVSFEKMRDFLDRGEFDIEIPRNDHLDTMMKAANTTTDLLLKRDWGVAFSENLEFVTCDNPVSLVWSSPVTIARPPGFGLPNTEVLVPLAKNLCLLGTYEALPRAVSIFEREIVEEMNSLTVKRAKRFIYGSNKELIEQLYKNFFHEEA